VVQLVSNLQRGDDAYLVGGQALNIWAERYWQTPGLAAFGPFTSKDIDYLGTAAAAEKLARALDGKVSFPNQEGIGPISAVVEAEIGDVRLTVDFLHHVLGVDPDRLKKLAVDIQVPSPSDGGRVLSIPIMHPVHCLQSRVANAYRLGRVEGIAARQLQAAPIVVDAYVREMLGLGHVKEVIASARELFEYLRSDKNGRRCHQILDADPLTIFEALSHNMRLDERYREKTLGPMIQRLKRIRSRVWPTLFESLLITEPENSSG